MNEVVNLYPFQEAARSLASEIIVDGRWAMGVSNEVAKGGDFV